MTGIPHARLVFEGSNGDATKAYYALLAAKGPIGHVAMNLFRAQKCSTRAKLYRGRSYKDEAYGRKAWSLGLLIDCLVEHGQTIGVTFGWGTDAGAFEDHKHVLYVDLPQGQVSFHGTARGKGADYTKPWDGQRGMSPVRILAFCDQVLGLPADPAPIAPELPPKNAQKRERWKAEKDAALQQRML